MTWPPSKGEYYYYIDYDGIIRLHTFYDDAFDHLAFEEGRAYIYEQEAIENVKKILKEYEVVYK